MSEHPGTARLVYIDNIRSTMIFLVVAVHAAVTYSHYGSWFYTAPENMQMPILAVFGMAQAFIQAFFMGILFLLAGYFTPTACDIKGSGRFVWDRFIRLGLPSLLFIFVICDTMGHYLLRWHGDTPFWPNYVVYVVHGDWVNGTGPMWFAVALLAFSIVYALIRLVRPYRPAAEKRPAPAAPTVIAAGAIIGLITFFVRLKWPVGTSFHNFQLCHFAQYIVFFVFGILARRHDWFAAFPARRARVLFWGAIVLGILVWVALVICGGVLTGNMAAYNGGWHGVSLGIALWEQMFGLCVSVGLIVLFRDRCNTGGAFSRLMRDNAFGIYLFHPPVLVALGLLMAPLAFPPEVKFLLMTAIGFTVTLMAVHLVLRRIPYLKRIL